MMSDIKTVRPASAFTLVEMLVSIAVLTIIVIFVAQLMSSATTVAALGNKRNDSDSQARLVFDRMASDFAGMIRRPDADYIFAKNTGNDTIYFYSEATKYFDSWVSDDAKSSVALLGYRINSNFQLERLSQGLTWDGTPTSGASPSPGSVVFLSYASPTPSPGATPISGSTIAGNWSSVVGSSPSYSNGSSADYHVIADQVYRLEVSFLRSDGTISNTVSQYNGLNGVVAINVALGMLDTSSRMSLLQNNQLPSATGNGMVGALPDSINGTPTLQTWNASNYLTASGIGQSIAAQLRICERTFYLNIP